MSDHTVLADALQGATVEMLREDAQWASGIAGAYRPSDPSASQTMDRLAALALAVAALQEGGGSALVEPNGYRLQQGESYLRRRDFAGPSGDTLPAALASLLRGAP